MADPSTILAILQFVDVAAKVVCEAVDKAIDEVIKHEHQERHALKELRSGVASLKSDTLVYGVLMDSMENDTDPSVRSPYTVFIQQYVIGLCTCSYAHRANT